MEATKEAERAKVRAAEEAKAEAAAQKRAKEAEAAAKVKAKADALERTGEYLTPYERKQPRDLQKELKRAIERARSTETGIERVRLLVTAGANLNTSSGANTPLSLLCVFGRNNEAIARVLIELGADVNYAPIGWSNSPLYYAITSGQVGMVKLLLEFGASTTKRGNHGTALECAQHWLEVREGHPHEDRHREIFELIRAAGVLLNTFQ